MKEGIDNRIDILSPTTNQILKGATSSGVLMHQFYYYCLKVSKLMFNNVEQTSIVFIILNYSQFSFYFAFMS